MIAILGLTPAMNSGVLVIPPVPLCEVVTSRIVKKITFTICQATVMIKMLLMMCVDSFFLSVKGASVCERALLLRSIRYVSF